MADLDVQPKKKSKSILPWILLGLGVLALIIFLARGCNSKTDDDVTAAPTPDSGSVVASGTGAVAQAADSTSTNVANWWDKVDMNAPSAKFDEITNKDINVRGNDRYGIYGVGEEILFDKGKSTIKPQAEANLKQIVASIGKRYNNGNIRIYGYTDAVGSADYNKELAEKRTEAVKNWLTSSGNLSATNITQHPVGEAQPQASNSTEAGRKQNRRVEIVAAAGQ